LACALPRGTARNAATCHRNRDVSTAEPASSISVTTVHKAEWPGPAASRQACGSPRKYTQTGRRSSTSATRTALKHHRMIARSPARTFDAAHPACAGLGGNLRMGLRPHPPHRSPTPGDTATASPPRTLRLACDASAPAPAEVARARGRPALANRRLAPSARRRVVELRPDPIRSDTSCHRTAPALGGDPNTAGRPAEAERQSSRSRLANRTS